DSTQSSEIIITGVAPIFINNKIQGYISASVFWDPNLLVVSKVPEYLQSRVSLYNSVVDFSQLKIFQFNDSKLVNVYGDIYPSREQVLPITSHNFSSSDDAWFVLDLNEEKYITYALKHNNDNKVSITAVSFLEQKISWSLFNFFKLFIIQSIFIVTLLIVLFLADIKNFNYTFKFQLTIAFLLISLIPVVVFGLYNRQLVEKRTDEAIQNELRERTNYVENYIRTNLNTQNEKDLNQIFEDAGNKLRISFSVFENGNRIFNSNVQYFNAGIFQTRINPVIYYNLNYLSFLEYRIKEAIERFAFNSYYKKVIINGRNYILSVDDLFNKVNLTLSPSDFDVLLFGIYLLAALIIILISTILADKISSPIRRLTKATLSVAQGDLSISLPNQQKGELRDLFNGFNLMTDELKRNQTELAELEREAAWKEMAKQVAHEIKNPLTPMKLSMQQLVALYNEKNKNFEQIFEKLSATILNQIESLSSIASEFSRFAKMPSYKNEQVDLPSIVRDVVNLFTDEQVTIKIETSVKNFTIMADNAQVRRLLINLIRNSIQAGANEIKLFIYCESDFCNLLVKDNGHGIQPENQDKIFDQNFTTKAAGMGLGLKLAKRFLGVIGGDIELVESNQISTTFRVKFPVLNKE
ncbi:MAG: HAMP domain-containing protein, partial [Ignavibacteriaceae bacterium]|nr:HAMP domain-containing protein [Ignavibacteriaceae bacterium]